MKTILAAITYHLGDIACRLSCWNAYDRLMNWSWQLDESGRIWKKSESSPDH